MSDEVRCAFAPGHVSGLFAVHMDGEDPMEQGSRGAGWCTERGAFAAVEEAEKTRITINGDVATAKVTRTALEHLAPAANLQIDLVLQLPIGQGFGMSAAGSLATCLAAADLLGLEPEHALTAAHVAEVSHGTGLGDAVSSWFGGGELRVKPGCPPHGWAMRVEPPDKMGFVYCVLGDAVDTAEVVRDARWQARTREHGDAAVDRIMEVGRERAWRQLIVESAVFSQKLGLMPARMRYLGDQVPDGVSWGQCMLGSTIWVAGDPGDLERAEALLEGHGEVIRGGIDRKGARLVRQIPNVLGL